MFKDKSFISYIVASLILGFVVGIWFGANFWDNLGIKDTQETYAYDTKYRKIEKTAEELAEEEEKKRISFWYGHWSEDDTHHLLVDKLREDIKGPYVRVEIDIHGAHGCFVKGRAVVMDDHLDFDMNHDVNKKLRDIVGYSMDNPCQFKLFRNGQYIEIKDMSEACKEQCGPGATFDGHNFKQVGDFSKYYE